MSHWHKGFCIDLGLNKPSFDVTNLVSYNDFDYAAYLDDWKLISGYFSITSTIETKYVATSDATTSDSTKEALWLSRLVSTFR